VGWQDIPALIVRAAKSSQGSPNGFQIFYDYVARRQPWQNQSWRRIDGGAFRPATFLYGFLCAPQ